MTQHGHSIANTMAKSITIRNRKRKKTKVEVHPGQPPPWAARGGVHGRGGRSSPWLFGFPLRRFDFPTILRVLQR